MSVANDTIAEFAEFTTTSPVSIEFVPIGTARGVVVGITQIASTVDLISGVTCEGVAMSRVDSASDVAGETGRSYLYFLGASITAGTVTIEITHTGAAASKWASVASVTAAANTEIVTFSKLEGDQANPQIALDTGATESLRMAIVHSGHDLPATLVEVSGMVAVVGASQNDFGAQIAKLGRQSTAATGSVTIGWTAATEDVAMVAVAIQEVAGATTVTPAVVASTSTLPTPTILAASNLTPAVIPIVASLPTPSIAAAASVTSAVVPLAVTLPTPIIVVEGATVVTPAVIAVVASLPIPAILAAANVTPAVIPLAALLPTPTVIAGVTGVATPAVIAVTVGLPTPSITTDAVVTPAGIALVVTVPTPSVTTPGLVTPAGISLIVTLPTPLATVGAITFWTPDPVAFIRIGPGDEPPWN